jgi:hypothetical protein
MDEKTNFQAIVKHSQRRKRDGMKIKTFFLLLPHQRNERELFFFILHFHEISRHFFAFLSFFRHIPFDFYVKRCIKRNDIAHGEKETL